MSRNEKMKLLRIIENPKRYKNFNLYLKKIKKKKIIHLKYFFLILNHVII
jgi:hypothetical protein